MSREVNAQFQREQLHRAARDGDLCRVRELLAAKYPVNRFDELGRTPLHHAVAGGYLAIVDALLRAGADVNAQDGRGIGDTPLAESAGSCSFEMAKRLIEAGTDPTLPGWMRLTAIHRAQDHKGPDGQQVLRLLKAAAAGRRP